MLEQDSSDILQGKKIYISLFLLVQIEMWRENNVPIEILNSSGANAEQIQLLSVVVDSLPCACEKSHFLTLYAMKSPRFPLR